MFNNPLTLTDPTGMFSWRGFLRTFGQVLNIVAIFVPQLQVFAQIFNGIMAYANGGLKGGLLNAFTSMIPGLNSVPGVWDNIGNLAISAAVGGASAMVMGGRFKEGAIGSLKSAAVSMTLGAIAQGAKSRQTGAKFANGADSDAALNSNAPGAAPGDASMSKSEYEQRAKDFGELEQGLSQIRGKSERSVADGFGELAVPFTEKWNVEVGANIVGYGNRLRLADIEMGTSTGVNIAQNKLAVAGVHTHPMGGKDGFSGHIMIKNKVIYRSRSGDLSTAYEGNKNYYAYRVGGSAWYFNQSAFRSDYQRAVVTRENIAASWDKYVERIK